MTAQHSPAPRSEKPSRGSQIALAAIALAAIATAAWFAFRRATDVPKPYERSVAEFTVRWTCDQGHAADAPGAAGPRPCPSCGRDSFATFGCACTNPACANVATMQLRYSDKLEIDAMRWRPAGEWQPYEFPPKCPKCGNPMRPG